MVPIGKVEIGKSKLVANAFPVLLSMPLKIPVLPSEVDPEKNVIVPFNPASEKLLVAMLAEKTTVPPSTTDVLSA